MERGSTETKKLLSKRRHSRQSIHMRIKFGDRSKERNRRRPRQPAPGIALPTRGLVGGKPRGCREKTGYGVWRRRKKLPLIRINLQKKPNSKKKGKPVEQTRQKAKDKKTWDEKTERCFPRLEESKNPMPTD